MGRKAETSVAESESESSAAEVVQSTADLASIASDMVTSMPEVQEHAIQKAQADSQASAGGPTDKSGTAFDPAIHEGGPDGKGVISVRGTWRLKRGGGRKAGSGSASMANGSSSLNAPTAPSKEQVTAAQNEHQAKLAGAACAQMMFMAGRALGGEEWTPRKDEKTGLDEELMMTAAFTEYCKVKNVTDIPPGVALAFAICVYAGPRLAMPQTKARVSGIKQRIVQWWVNRKLRKQGLQASVTPRSTEVSEPKKA